MLSPHERAVVANLRSRWYASNLPPHYCITCAGETLWQCQDDVLHPPRDVAVRFAYGPRDVNSLLRIIDRLQGTELPPAIMSLADAAEGVLEDTNDAGADTVDSLRERLDATTMLLRGLVRVRDNPPVACMAEPTPWTNVASVNEKRGYFVESTGAHPADVCDISLSDTSEHAYTPSKNVRVWFVAVTEAQYRQLVNAHCFTFRPSLTPV